MNAISRVGYFALIALLLTRTPAVQAQTTPSQANPSQTNPSQTNPSQANPSQANPSQTNPSQTTRPAATTIPSVDIVTLRQGKPVRGLVLSSAGPTGPLVMVVERESFAAGHATLYERAARLEREQAIDAWTQLARRLHTELKAVGEDQLALKAFYQQQLEKAEQAMAKWQAQAEAPLDYRFMWLDLSSKEIDGVRQAPLEARRTAVWAWSQRISQVPTRQPGDLERELKRAGIDATQEPPDLSPELAPRTESDDVWAMRVAIARYAFSNGLDYQGSGGVFVRTGAEAGAIELAPLIQKMLGGSLDSLLDDLDPTRKRSRTAQASNEWYRSIVPQAEALGRHEFRATQIEPDPSGQAATVMTAFVAQMPTQAWRVVWSTTQTMRADDVTAAAQQRIAEDPQVKSALSLLAALGANGETEIRKAIRYGAATMAAQQAADKRFFQFRDRYAQRLDGPPLP